MGILSKEQARMVSAIFQGIRVLQDLNVVVKALSDSQAIHNAAVAVSNALHLSSIGPIVAHTAATIAHTVAQAAAAIATWIHANGQLLLLAALTFGVGAIIAVTAALLAMTMAQNAAAQSAANLRTAMSGVSGGMGGAFALGESALLRQGVTD